LGELDRIVEQVDLYRDKCRELLQSKVYGIDKRLAALPNKRESTTYDGNAEGVTGSLRSKTFEKKI
jgi:hypothetical protein